MGELAKSFDYNQIEDKDVRGKLVYFSGQLRKEREAASANVIAQGKLLHEANELLADHRDGLFQRWLDDEFDMSKSTAYRMMSAYRIFDGCPTVGQLEVSAMYALASDQCPENATKEALKLANRGERISQKRAKQLIAKYTVEAEDVEEIPQPEPEPEPEPVISGEALEALRRAKIEPTEAELKALAEYDETSQVWLAQSAAKGVQKLSQAVETGHVPELWEELAVVHRDAVKKLNEINRVFSKMAEDEERGGHIQHVITRIVADIRQLKATIGQATPVGEKGGKIVTKADEQRGK